MPPFLFQRHSHMRKDGSPPGQGSTGLTSTRFASRAELAFASGHVCEICLAVLR